MKYRQINIFLTVPYSLLDPKDRSFSIQTLCHTSRIFTLIPPPERHGGRENGSTNQVSYPQSLTGQVRMYCTSFKTLKYD